MGESRASTPKSWGAPLTKLDQAWTRLEQRIAVGVIVAEIATLCLWVSLKGLASYYTPDGDVIGLIFRSIFTGIALGLIAHALTRKKSAKIDAISTTTAVFIGLLLGRAW